MANRTLKYLAAAGIGGTVLYTVTWLVLGFLDPTYSHIRDPISNLSAIGAPHALVMTSIIFVFALLIIVFAFGLHRGLPPGSWAGPGALVIAGVGYLGIGLAPLNLAEPGDPNLPHEISAAVIVFGLMLAPLLLSPRLKRDPLWQNLRGYSIATTVVSLALVVALALTASLPAFLDLAGLQQRLVLAVVSVWIIVMAIRLFRHPLLKPGGF